MTMTIDPVDLARALIAAPSVTPATGAVFDVLEAALGAPGLDAARERGVVDGGVNHDGSKPHFTKHGVGERSWPSFSAG